MMSAQQIMQQRLTLLQIKGYMTQLEWSIVDLHRVTLISLQTLDDIMNLKTEITYYQLMIIVNKITKQYPADMHWDIYHSIVVQPTMTKDK